MPAEVNLINTSTQVAIREGIAEALGSDWAASKHRLDVSGDAVADEVIVRFFYETTDQTIRYVLEVGLEAKSPKLSPTLAMEAAVDVAAGLFVEFVEAGHHSNLPLEWGHLEVDGKILRCRAEMTRPNLDSLADAWLAGEGSTH